MVRLYVNASLAKNTVFSVSEAQSHYLQKVMRLKEGDTLLVFNGSQGEWSVKITSLTKKATLLQVEEQTRPPQDEGDIWLLFSPLKPKSQAFLEEKATELGVSRLWPIRCERTSVSTLNMMKMEAHVIEAAEQSDRLTLPSLHPFTPLLKLLDSWPQERFLVFGDETLTAPSLETISRDTHPPYAFFVGPEGGFSPQELTLLRNHPNSRGVTLNPHILRAETAALVGISYLQISLHNSFK